MQTIAVAKVVLKGLNLHAKGMVVKRMIVSGVGLFYAGVDLKSCQKEQQMPDV